MSGKLKTKITSPMAKSTSPGLSVSRSVAVVSLNDPQRAKKLVSDRLGLMDFVIGLKIFLLKLHDRQVLFFGKIQITEGL